MSVFALLRVTRVSAMQVSILVAVGLVAGSRVPMGCRVGMDNLGVGSEEVGYTTSIIYPHGGAFFALKTHFMVTAHNTDNTKLRAVVLCIIRYFL